MPITVDWPSGEIYIPISELVLVQSTPTTIYNHDLFDFYKKLRIINEGSEGRAFPIILDYNPPATVGGVVLSAVLSIRNYYTVTYEDGQYAVNLKGLNSNVGDRVNVNQVSVRSNNSAGLQDLSVILSAAYGGEVSVAITQGQNGTAPPLGTLSFPSNNFDDAKIIAANTGSSRFRIKESINLVNEDFSSGYTFTSGQDLTVAITVDQTSNTDSCIFDDTLLFGSFGDIVTIKKSSLESVSLKSTLIEESALNGTITLSPNSIVLMNNCYTNTLDGVPTIIDMGSSAALENVNFSGKITLKNFNTAGIENQLFFSSGEIIFDPTITDGIFVIYGLATIDDNSTGNAIIIDKTTQHGAGGGSAFCAQDISAMINKSTITAIIGESINVDLEDNKLYGSIASSYTAIITENSVEAKVCHQI